MTSALRAIRRKLAGLVNRDAPEYASFLSFVACVILAVGSIGIGLAQHSLIVQTNGYITLIDIGNSLLFLTAVRRSSRNADLTFNYGYGKYESLAILASATLLFVLTLFTFSEAIGVFRQPPDDRNISVLLVWSVVSFFVMRYTARRLEKSARRFHMPMLHYDAELWRVDSWVEVIVVLGLLASGALQHFSSYGTAAIVDGVVSITLILVTVKVPLRHGRDAFRQLLDRTLPDEMQYEILAIIAENYHRMCEFRSVHTRQSGKDIFVEIDLVMPYDYTLEKLYETEKEILSGINAKFPTALPRVYVTPCDKTCVNGTTACPVRQAMTSS